MYLIEIKTDIDLCDEQFVRSLLFDWHKKINPLLRIERFAQGEPIRRSFEKEGVDSAVEIWLKDKLPLMLKRITSPKFEVDISGYNALRTTLNQFPSKCTTWLNFKAGDALAIELFKFLIEKFEPGFGFISTEKDQEEKHFVTAIDRVGGTTEAYVGLEVGEKFPGIYWVTYFSEWAISKIGSEKFNKINVYDKQEFQNGFLIMAHKNSNEIAKPETEAIEQNLLSTLGEEMFFKKEFFNVDSLLEL